MISLSELTHLFICFQDKGQIITFVHKRSNMSTLREKYISEALLGDKPKKKLALIIKDGSITLEKLAKGLVHPRIVLPKATLLALLEAGGPFIEGYDYYAYEGEDTPVLIVSCYGTGAWLDDEVWMDDDVWTDGL